MAVPEAAHEVVLALNRHGNHAIDSLGTELALIALASSGIGGSLIVGTVTAVDTTARTLNASTADGPLSGVPTMHPPIASDVGTDVGIFDVFGDGTNYLVLGPGTMDDTRVLVTDWTGLGPVP